MFLNKDKKKDLIDLSQIKELRPEDIPIHTMLGDLQNLEHPEKKVQESILEKAPLPPKKGVLSDVQADSPFLSGKTAIESLTSENKIPPPPIPVKNEQKEERIANFFSSKPKMDISVAPEPPKEVPKKEEIKEARIGSVFPATTRMDLSAASVTLKDTPKETGLKEVKQGSYFSVKPKMDLSAAPEPLKDKPAEATPFSLASKKETGPELPRNAFIASIKEDEGRDSTKGKDRHTPQAEKDLPSHAQIKQEVKDLVSKLPKPEKGRIPGHEWNEDKTQVRFENPDGSWGAWSDILKGKDGKVVRGDSGEDKFSGLADAPKSYSDQNGKSQETVMAPAYSVPPADPIRMDEEIINTEPPVREPKLSDIFVNPEEKTMYIPTNEKPVGSGIGKIIGSIAVILIIIILGGGGYYYWMIRQDKPIEVMPPPPVEIPVEPEPISPINTSKFNLDKPNYLQVDIGKNSTAGGIKNSVLKYVQNVKEEKITEPLEFLVTDTENNPVSFQVFAEKMEIGLSKNILAAFDNSFSLFVYGDNGNYRIGLVINSKGGFDVGKLMLAEEPKLISELKNLFLDISYTEPKNLAFSSGSYNTYPVRYLNIISPRELSLDYTILNKKLVIGTTMLTNRTIVDNISKERAETTLAPGGSSLPK